MARRRMIDPKFWGDETIGKLDAQERLFYIGLFSLADDEGRICGSPAYLRSQIYPYDDTPLDSIVTWTLHLKDIGLIHIYDDPTGNGSTYIDHPKWLKYQRIDNPAPSLLPPCPLFRSHWRKPRTVIKKPHTDSKNDSKNDSRVKERKLKKIKGKEVREERKRIKDIPFVELFNSTCPSLQKIEEVTRTRLDKIKTRLKEHPDLKWWSTVFERADKMNFTYEKGAHKGKVWRPSFDWLIENDNNAVKVAEGHYEDKKKETWRD